jgi:hypothetical protein
MILAKVCAVALSPVREDNQKVYVKSLLFNKAQRQISILGLVHVKSPRAVEMNESGYYTYSEGYRRGTQKLLTPHKRTIIVEDDLMQLLNSSTRAIRYDFASTDRVWKKIADSSGGLTEESKQTERSASFHSFHDVKDNILRFQSERTQSIEDLKAFPSKPLFSKANERTLVSIDMAMTILRHFHDNPNAEKLKLVCGLYHQQQVAALLKDPNLLFDSQRLFYNAAGFFYKNDIQLPITHDSVFSWWTRNHKVRE